MYEYKAVIVRVIDGDTVDIDIDLGFRITTRQRVRLAGINAPEMSAEGGVESKTALIGMLMPTTPVTVTSEKPGGGDKYGRYLAYICRAADGGVSVNTLMVTQGYAVAWDGTGTKPV